MPTSFIIATIATFLYLLSPAWANAQQMRHISGKILSSTDSLPVPFAHIFSLVNSQKTATKTDGSFSFLSPMGEEIKLMVSHVAYISTPIIPTTDTIVVYLQPTAFVMDEVEILRNNFAHQQKCVNILSKAAKTMHEHYSQKTTMLGYHYVETVKFDSLYGRFFECTGALLSAPFRKKRKRSKQTLYSATILHRRGTENYNSDFRLHNGLIHLTNQDYIKYAASFLTKNSNREYTYRYDGTASFHNRAVHKISFVPKASLAKPYPSGFIYVTVEKPTVVALSTILSENLGYPTRTRNDGKQAKTVQMKTYVSYAPHENFWILDNLSKTEVIQVSESEKVIYTAEVNLTLKVSNLFAADSRVSGSHVITDVENIYGKSDLYLEEFWNRQEIESQSAPTLKQAKKDLERNGRSLESQFRSMPVIEENM